MVEGLKSRIGSRETNWDNANISFSKDHSIVDEWKNWIRDKYLIRNNAVYQVIDSYSFDTRSYLVDKIKY